MVSQLKTKFDIEEMQKLVEEFAAKSIEFDEELKVLFDKHFDSKVTDIMVILITEENNDPQVPIKIGILGSACPVCINELLTMRVMEGSLQHIKRSKTNKSVEDKDKNNNLGYKDV